MTEYDDDGQGIPGTYAISTVRILGSKADGTPVATISSAVCDVCHGWASQVFTSGVTHTLTDDLVDVRVRRRVRVTAYACPAHADQIADALVDEFGHAVNRHDPDELAARVDREDRMLSADTP